MQKHQELNEVTLMLQFFACCIMFNISLSNEFFKLHKISLEPSDVGKIAATTVFPQIQAARFLFEYKARVLKYLVYDYQNPL